MNTWKEISKGYKEFTQWNHTNIAEELAFFKVEFKQMLKEMVGEEINTIGQEYSPSVHMYNIYRQEMLDKINKFFGETEKE